MIENLSVNHAKGRCLCHNPVIYEAQTMSVAVGERVLSLGAIDFIQKPIDPQKIETVLRQYGIVV